MDDLLPVKRSAQISQTRTARELRGLASQSQQSRSLIRTANGGPSSVIDWLLTPAARYAETIHTFQNVSEEVRLIQLHAPATK